MTVVEAQLREHAETLTRWTVEHAFPLWASEGVDRVSGAFRESLNDDGRLVDVHRRARVQPRQVHAFSHAAGFGWDGPAEAIIREGLGSAFARYQRADGLFRTLVAADGTVQDDNALLYDQAFVLLALAGAHAALGADAHQRAVALRTAIGRVWTHPSGGFLSGDKKPLPLLANPHMHLLEACLAWEAIGDAEWSAMSDRIVGLALERMIGASGALTEAFDEEWRRVEGLAGRIVEPGHQFEWAWLLLRWGWARGRGDAIAAALRLIEVGERFGVDRDRGVVVLELLDDMSVQAPVGRLWAQTERVKAGCLAALTTGKDRYLEGALAGCESVRAFLEAAPRLGLWRDQMAADGRFVVEATPASTFYHIVVAIDVLRDWVRRRPAAL